MGRHAEKRDPITDPVNIDQILDHPNKEVKSVRIRHTVQERPVEPLGVVTEGNGLPVVRKPRRVPAPPRRSPGAHRPNARTSGPVEGSPSKVERALAVHRIIRAFAFLILCAIAGVAWTGLLLTAWDIVSKLWWCWVFVIGSVVGVVLFSYDAYLAIKYRRVQQALWKGMA